LATYREPYSPRYRLVSSWAEGGSNKPANCFGYTIPSEFVCNFCVVSDNGKVISKAVADSYPVFIISLIIRISKHGTPELLDVDLKGETSQRQFPVGIALRELVFNDVKPLTPWQLNFVANYRTQLIQLAVENIASKWSYSIKNGKATWSYPFSTTERLSEPEKGQLKKKIEKRLRVKLTDDHYEKIAQSYLNYTQAGLKPIVELSKDFPEANYRTIQRWADESRKRGFLSKTTQGKVSSVKEKRKGKNANNRKAKRR
jgi:hypothetical protein